MVQQSNVLRALGYDGIAQQHNCCLVIREELRAPAYCCRVLCLSSGQSHCLLQCAAPAHCPAIHDKYIACSTTPDVMTPCIIRIPIPHQVHALHLLALCDAQAGCASQVAAAQSSSVGAAMWCARVLVAWHQSGLVQLLRYIRLLVPPCCTLCQLLALKLSPAVTGVALPFASARPNFRNRAPADPCWLRANPEPTRISINSSKG